MIRCPTTPMCRNRPHLADLHKEGDELPRAFREMLRPPQDRRIVGEELRVMPTDHPGARARGSDNMVIALESIEDEQADRLCVDAIARIVRRLAATGLGSRHIDRAARLLEQFDRGEPDRRPEQIDKAGNKEGYAHRSFRLDRRQEVRGFGARIQFDRAPASGEHVCHPLGSEVTARGNSR